MLGVRLLNSDLFFIMKGISVTHLLAHHAAAKFSGCTTYNGLVGLNHGVGGVGLSFLAA